MIMITRTLHKWEGQGCARRKTRSLEGLLIVKQEYKWTVQLEVKKTAKKIWLRKVGKGINKD